jgi:hypothetical protein
MIKKPSPANVPLIHLQATCLRSRTVSSKRLQYIVYLHVIALIRLADGDNRHEVAVGVRQEGHVLLHICHRVVGRPVHAVTCLLPAIDSY